MPETVVTPGDDAAAVHGVVTPGRQQPAGPLFDEAHYVTSSISDAGQRELVEYGKAIAEETWRHIGPKAADPSKRFAGNELACKNCHLKAGLQPFAAPWVGITGRYPSFRGRENRVATLEQRINGCMERSMDGKPMPEEGREMRALVAWMQWLSHLAPADGKVAGAGFEPFEYPDRAVDLHAGKNVYSTRCVSCHGPDAAGIHNPTGGYAFPALAGDDSYNDGAGMHRVLTAAAFIRNNMPLGSSHAAPQLSLDEAFDVAGYIDSLPRAAKTQLEADFPDRKRKPMSTPYGPWADDFSAEQHKYGPYREIHDFYARNYDMKKNK